MRNTFLYTVPVCTVHICAKPFMGIARGPSDNDCCPRLWGKARDLHDQICILKYCSGLKEDEIGRSYCHDLKIRFSLLQAGLKRKGIVQEIFRW